MIEKMVEIGTLFEFYGRLLTDKQYDAVDLYYINDLSLGEIGEKLDVSRQGIFDTLKRAENNLYRYEKDLKLIDKFYKNQEDIKKIINISEEISEITKDGKIRLKTDEINNICKKLIL